MRVRTQKSNVLVPPKYEKEVGTVVVFDDRDEPIFAVTMTPAGTYSFTHIGHPDFPKDIKAITGLSIRNPELYTLDLGKVETGG